MRKARRGSAPKPEVAVPGTFIFNDNNDNYSTDINDNNENNENTDKNGKPSFTKTKDDTQAPNLYTTYSFTV